jgi:GNAT superfamily N-acetyltransferase
MATVVVRPVDADGWPTMRGVRLAARQDARTRLALRISEANFTEHDLAVLVEVVLRWARAEGHHRVHLWVTETNAPPRRLYQGSGFAVTGARLT